jgi:hypothetical protein
MPMHIAGVAMLPIVATKVVALPSEFQPISIEIKMADGVFVKSMMCPRAGTIVPQHAHRYDHLSMLARGAVRVWKDGKMVGVFTAPAGIPIPANSMHTFHTLEPDTLIYCIHNVSRTDDVDIAAENSLDLAGGI